jgi:hypothetical protein
MVKWLIRIALSPFLVLVSLIFVPVITALAVRDWWRRRKFRLGNAGRYFLVCTTRRGWHEFIRNNVEPVLPSSTTLCWAGRIYRDRRSTEVVQAVSSLVRRHSRPYLIAVSRSGIEALALHEKLLPLKQHAKKSVETQVQVAEIMRAVFEASPLAQDEHESSPL